MLVLIDNYDSFVYNLYQYLAELGQQVVVFRNNKVTLAEIEALSPSHIIISPGPCSPNEAGISMDVITYFAGKVPVLGVCLGHQSIGQAFGGKVLRSPRMMHGKTSQVRHDGRVVYKNLPNPMTTARYHSLIVERSELPPVLEITSETLEGELMGVRHKEYTVEGVQFHPESILTTTGKELLANFLQLKGGYWHENPAFA